MMKGMYEPINIFLSQLKIVKTYTHVGTWVSVTGHQGRDIGHGAQSHRSTFKDLKANILRKKDLANRSRMMVLGACCESRFL